MEKETIIEALKRMNEKLEKMTTEMSNALIKLKDERTK